VIVPPDVPSLRLQVTLPPPVTVAEKVCTPPAGIVTAEGLIETVPVSAVTLKLELVEGTPTGAGFVTTTG
jgi:hypothetical protein